MSNKSIELCCNFFIPKQQPSFLYQKCKNSSVNNQKMQTNQKKILKNYHTIDKKKSKPTTSTTTNAYFTSLSLTVNFAKNKTKQNQACLPTP